MTGRSVPGWSGSSSCFLPLAAGGLWVRGTGRAAGLLRAASTGPGRAMSGARKLPERLLELFLRDVHQLALGLAPGEALHLVHGAVPGDRDVLIGAQQLLAVLLAGALDLVDVDVLDHVVVRIQLDGPLGRRQARVVERLEERLLV